MDKNLLDQDTFPHKSTGASLVTRKLLRERAVELAEINGRAAHDVSKADWEQAKRDLMGASDPKENVQNAVPESERWDPVPGSVGHQAPESPVEGEDDEGRSETEQLVDAGAMEAERDRQRQASRAGEKKEPGQP